MLHQGELVYQRMVRHCVAVLNRAQMILCHGLVHHKNDWHYALHERMLLGLYRFDMLCFSLLLLISNCSNSFFFLSTKLVANKIMYGCSLFTSIPYDNPSMSLFSCFICSSIGSS